MSRRTLVGAVVIGACVASILFGLVQSFRLDDANYLWFCIPLIIFLD